MLIIYILLSRRWGVELDEQLLPGVDADFEEDMFGMLLDGAVGNEELVGDLAPGEAVAQQDGDLGLPGGEHIAQTVGRDDLGIHGEQAKVDQLALVGTAQGHGAVEEQGTEGEETQVGEQRLGQLSPTIIDHRGEECPWHDGQVGQKLFKVKAQVALLPITNADRAPYGHEQCQ